MGNESLITDVVGKLKKKFGDANLTTLGEESFTSKPTFWVSTGSTILDAAIGGWQDTENGGKGGLPGGKVIDLHGNSASGKSALLFSILAHAQKAGGIAVLLETEGSADLPFAQMIGVNTEQLIISQPNTIEEIFDEIELIISSIREEDENIPIVIGIDSCVVATKAEWEKSLTDAKKIGEDAFAWRRALKKLATKISRERVMLIGINHIVNDPMKQYGPKTTPTGGTGWIYWPHVRVKTAAIEKIVNPRTKFPDGIVIKAEVVKNKIGIPHREAEFHFYFNSGIDDIESMVEFCRKNGIFGTKSGWLEYGGKNMRKAEVVSMFRTDPEKVEWLKARTRELVLSSGARDSDEIKELAETYAGLFEDASD